MFEMLILPPHPSNARLAMTLNGFQPVVCTIISDEPFFYQNKEAGNVTA